MFSTASKAAGIGHKLVVTGLISTTLFMCYTAVNQSLYLRDRRHRLNEELKQLQAAEQAAENK